MGHFHVWSRARAGNVQREVHVRLDLAADESLGAGLAARSAVADRGACRCSLPPRRAARLSATLFVLVSERREIAALA
jgi:hypothetical protein